MTGLIETYEGPLGYPSEVWEAIRPTVLRRVKACKPQSTRAAYDRLVVNARYAAWLHTTGYDPHDDALAFEPVLYERFVLTGCPELAKNSRTNYRRFLRDTAKALPDAPFVHEPVKLSRAEMRPAYTPEQQAALWSWACGQPEGLRLHGCQVLVAFSLGAGLDTHDFRHTRSTDVHRHEDGTVTVNVQGNKARTTVLLPEWENEAWALAAESQELGDYLWHPTSTNRTSENAVTQLLGRTRTKSGPWFRTSQARTTYIVALLNRGTPVRVVAAAAGLAIGSMTAFLNNIEPLERVTAAEYRFIRSPGEHAE